MIQRARMAWTLVSILAFSSVASAFLAPAIQRPVPSMHHRTRQFHRQAVVTMMGRKFENNKLKMAKTAAAYSKKASYFGKKIAQCVQAKGPNVESNRELGNLMREAKAAGVRADVVERNIKKAVEKPTDFKELTYEAYGCGGVGFVISCLSDSHKRATADVNACVKKLGEKSNPSFKMGSSGSVLFNFEKKARLSLSSEVEEDKVLELAIEAGVDDFELLEADEVLDGESAKAALLTMPEDLGAMQAALQEIGIESSGLFTNVPLATVTCSEEDLAANLDALEKLEEIEDVDTVEHNMFIPDDA